MFPYHGNFFPFKRTGLIWVFQGRKQEVTKLVPLCKNDRKINMEVYLFTIKSLETLESDMNQLSYILDSAIKIQVSHWMLSDSFIIFWHAENVNLLNQQKTIGTFKVSRHHLDNRENEKKLLPPKVTFKKYIGFSMPSNRILGQWKLEARRLF